MYDVERLVPTTRHMHVYEHIMVSLLNTYLLLEQEANVI